MFILLYLLSVVNALCPRSAYVDENGKCAKCKSGYYCPDGVNIYKCPEGTYSDVWKKECFKCGCDGCIQANIVNETSKEVIKYAGSCSIDGTCYPGFGMDPDTKSCQLCNAGKYSLGKDMKCKLCGNHFYNDQPGSTYCKECPPDEEDVNLHSGCAKCQPGYYLDEKHHACLTCPPNTITQKESERQCISCGEDQHANYDRTKCLPGAYKEIKYRNDFIDPLWDK